MITGYLWDSFYYTTPNTTGNLCGFNDPYMNETIQLMAETGWDMELKYKTYKERHPQYLLSQAPFIALPCPNWYVFWQPWLKNYHGEVYVGYTAWVSFVRWVWIDQDLKESMIGVR